MKKHSTLWVLIVILVVIATGTSVYFGKTEVQKGSLTGSSFDINNKAFYLVDSAHSDTNFDGILDQNDRCQGQPPYGVIRFGIGSYAYSLGQVITLKSVDSSGNMSFDVSGTKYNVKVGAKTAIAPISNRYKGFGILGLFFSTGSGEAIVVVQNTDYNPTTGCMNR